MSANDSGHVFVIQGDLTKVAADHYIIPCDNRLNFTKSFRSLIQGSTGGDYGWLRPVGLVAPVEFEHKNRRPVLVPAVNVGSDVRLVNTAVADPATDDDVAWLMAGVRTAIGEIAQSQSLPRNDRARRLVALPIVGVGAGGFQNKRDGVIRALLQALQESVEPPGSPDVVLVLWRRADYAAIQTRRQDSKVHPIREEAQTLATRIRKGELVAFLGAGVSQSAGLPSWDRLLDDLTSDVLGWEEHLVTLLKDLPMEDQAQVLENSMGRSPGLAHKVVDLVSADQYGLGHGLVASLRLPEMVTTNYDTLLEEACRVTHDDDLRVLPRQSITGDQPWLLKLHGDIRIPKTIVLTRQSYLRFDSDSAPLASMVQAHMMTRHMLFIGYSLSDSNFIRLAHQVRNLMNDFEGSSEPVGTVVTLSEPVVQEKLWGSDMAFLPVADSSTEDPGSSSAAAAREVEILLDEIGMMACDEVPYLLDPTYQELLKPADNRLVQKLGPVIDEWRTRNGETHAWKKVDRLLRELGAR